MAIKEWILKAIMQEREAQKAQWDKEHSWGYGDCSSNDVEDIVKSSVLSEECGEVSRAVLDCNQKSLRKELIQVAAVAVAWLESMKEI